MTTAARSSSRRCRRTFKSFEYAMIAFSLLCVVIVLVIVLGTDIGNTAR